MITLMAAYCASVINLQKRLIPIISHAMYIFYHLDLLRLVYKYRRHITADTRIQR